MIKTCSMRLYLEVFLWSSLPSQNSKCLFSFYFFYFRAKLKNGLKFDIGHLCSKPCNYKYNTYMSFTFLHVHGHLSFVRHTARRCKFMSAMWTTVTTSSKVRFHFLIHFLWWCCPQQFVLGRCSKPEKYSGKKCYSFEH